MDWVNFIMSIGWIPIICLVVGLILVIFEMFNPGFGAPGVTGLVLLVLSIVLSARSLVEALIMILVIIIILGIAFIFVFRSATRGKLSKKLVLGDSMDKESGYIGVNDLSDFVGKEGITISVLRPSGTADFDGMKLDVVSESTFIPKGKRVKVVQVNGPRIVVREISS